METLDKVLVAFVNMPGALLVPLAFVLLAAMFHFMNFNMLTSQERMFG